MVLLKANCEARFSLFAVEAVEPGVGVQVRDLLRGDSQFIVDVGYSQSAAIGAFLAARIMAPEGICMTTGAALPIGLLPEVDRAAFVRLLVATSQAADLRHLWPQEASDLATRVIRHCLEHGAAEKIRYIDSAQPPGA